ncbi:MAG: hypothetical protein OXT67_14035, partial [Zetaproteobacteria bacterium]|nr:hypothetical protein [Zetaproteobacteria bacterium]
VEIECDSGMARIELSDFDSSKTYRVNFYLDDKCVAEQVEMTNGQLSFEAPPPKGGGFLGLTRNRANISTS